MHELNLILFEEIMDKFNVKSTTNKWIYELGEYTFKILPGDKVVIEGNIPYELANTIFEKYSNYNFQIMDTKHNIKAENNLNPIDYIYDEKYLKNIKMLDNVLLNGNYSEKFYNRLQNRALLKLQKRLLETKSYNDKYVSGYVIDTLEGLVAFIIELKKFNIGSVAEVKEIPYYDEILNDILESYLNKLNLSVTPQEWMLNDVNNYNRYLKGLNEKENEIDNLIREKVENYDKSINPFINKEIELKSINDIIKNVNFDSYAYKSLRHSINSSIVFSNKNDNTENSVSISYSEKSFNYSLDYITTQNYIYINHSFYGLERDKDDNFEYINIETVNAHDRHVIQYNLTDGVIVKTEGIDMTEDAIKELICEYLDAGIKLANTITINNMENRSEKLVLNIKNAIRFK